MPSTDLNRRLTTTDASFLYVEKPNEPMHIGSCNVYDGHFSKQELEKVLEERLHLLPRYRQKVVFPPFGLAHPTWEDDESFDVRNHVEEVTLPAPGDDQVMSEVGGQVYSQMLDRNRPLWKLVLLQGRADGNTVMIAMVHHAMVDGISGVELQMVLHDLTQKVEAPAAPPPWQPRPAPDPLSLMQDAVRDRLTELAELWTDQAFLPLRPEASGARTRQVTNAMTSSMPYVLQPAPRTPFNNPVSNQRQFGWLELSFTDIRAIRGALGGTINDVVLAVLSGGMGRYLRAHGQQTLPAMELRAMCPVSVRSETGRGALGNQVSMMLAPLYVGIIDPVERFRAERGAMERLKSLDQAGGLNAMTQMANMIPPSMQAFAASFEAQNTLLNTVSTNVPGPQIPLFLRGHKLLQWIPMGPLSAGIGLFQAILSYNQKLTFGTTVDPVQVSDVWFFIDCLGESFAELSEAAARVASERAETERQAEAERRAEPEPAGAAPRQLTSGKQNGARLERTKERERATVAR